MCMLPARPPSCRPSPACHHRATWCAARAAPPSSIRPAWGWRQRQKETSTAPSASVRPAAAAAAVRGAAGRAAASQLTLPQLLPASPELSGLPLSPSHLQWASCRLDACGSTALALRPQTQRCSKPGHTLPRLAAVPPPQPSQQQRQRQQQLQQQREAAAVSPCRWMWCRLLAQRISVSSMPRSALHGRQAQRLQRPPRRHQRP